MTAGDRSAERRSEFADPARGTPNGGGLPGAAELPARASGAGTAPADTLPQVTVARRTVFRFGMYAVVLLVSLYLFTVVHGTERAPDYALVYAQVESKSFTTPSCAAGVKAPLELTTIREATARGFHMDQACWIGGGFFGTSSSRWEGVLRFIHLYPQKGTRWRADGTWKW
jgi:hypothetical protein